MLQRIDLDRGCFSCALGGTDKRTLFLVATEWRGPASAAGLAVDLVAVAVDIETNVAIETVAAADLPRDWRRYPAPPALALIGERWLRESRAAVLSVPSVVIPQERNFVLNPSHADIARLTIGPSEPFSFDPRMWMTRG